MRDARRVVPLIAVVIVLGLVEGLTEFLPVSSTGHLVLVEALLPGLGARADAFRIAIQLGAVAAVAWTQRARFTALLRPAEAGRFGGARGIALLALVTAPALLVGFALRHQVREWQEPIPVAIALAVGGVGLLALERLRGDRGTASMDGLGVRAALGIGLFQCLALWPGISRAGATIAGAMLLGLTRRAATELSFVAAVPVIAAATGYALASDPESLVGEALAMLAVGAVVAAAAAIVAVRAFTAFVARSTMEPFAWYRLALAAVVAAVALS